jgi:zinc transporter ZupT
MTIFLWALIANIIIAIGIVVMILVLKRFQQSLTRNINGLTAFTVGILFFLIFAEFIPELTENLEGKQVGLYLLAGLMLFYVLELMFHWHHCNDLAHSSCDHGHTKAHQHTELISIGTSLHNIFHGIILYSAFAISIQTGIALSIGIFLHALPQNLANYVMNHKKMKYVVMAALGGILGVFIAHPFGSAILDNTYIILAITAGGLTYLSLSDILPSIQGNANTVGKTKYLVLVVLGIITMMSMESMINYWFV